MKLLKLLMLLSGILWMTSTLKAEEIPNCLNIITDNQQNISVQLSKFPVVSFNEFNKCVIRLENNEITIGIESINNFHYSYVDESSFIDIQDDSLDNIIIKDGSIIINKPSQIYIVDTNGRLLFSNNSYKGYINFNELNNGIYIITINDIIYKIIKN